MRRIAFSVLWLFVLLIPLEGVLVLPGLGTINKLVGLLAFAVWGLVMIRQGSIRRPSSFHVLLLVFGFWGLLSYTWSIDKELSWERISTLVQLLPMIWLIWELARESAEQKALMQAYCFGTAILCVQIASNYASVPVLSSFFPRFTAFDVDANMTALRIALAVPMALGAATSARTIIQWFNWLLVPLAAFALILTGSRSGTLALAAALLSVPFAARALSPAKRVLLSLGLVGAVAVLATMISPVSFDRISTIPTELEAATQGGDGDVNVRVRIWEKGLEGVPDHLLAGVGIGAFRTSVAKDFNAGYGAGAHNSFLAILVEQGVIGLTLFLALLGALVLGTRRMGRLERRLAIILILTWSISVFFIRQHDKKHTWFVFGLLATQAGCVAAEKRKASGWEFSPTGTASALPQRTQVQSETS